MTRLWRKILGGIQVEPGEGSKVGLLLAHSLANGLFESFFLAAATAQFLSQFDAKVLPLTYVAAGGIGYLTLSFFAFLRRRVGFTVLLLGHEPEKVNAIPHYWRRPQGVVGYRLEKASDRLVFPVVNR